MGGTHYLFSSPAGKTHLTSMRLNSFIPKQELCATQLPTGIIPGPYYALKCDQVLSGTVVADMGQNHTRNCANSFITQAPERNAKPWALMQLSSWCRKRSESENVCGKVPLEPAKPLD